MTTEPTPPVGVSVVVRLKTPHLSHPAGTYAIVVDQAPFGRERYRVMVPGDPCTFTPLARDLEVVRGVDPGGWWHRSKPAPVTTEPTPIPAEVVEAALADFWLFAEPAYERFDPLVRARVERAFRNVADGLLDRLRTSESADPTPPPVDDLDPQYLTDVQAVALMLAHRLYNFENGSAIGQAAEKIVTSEWLGKRDERMRAAGRTAAAAREQALIDALADCVVKSTEYGTQDGGFMANYITPTGPIHRAIPLLQELGITVRPGFDGRAAARVAENGADHA